MRPDSRTKRSTPYNFLENECVADRGDFFCAWLTGSRRVNHINTAFRIGSMWNFLFSSPFHFPSPRVSSSLSLCCLVNTRLPERWWCLSLPILERATTPNRFYSPAPVSLHSCRALSLPAILSAIVGQRIPELVFCIFEKDPRPHFNEKTAFFHSTPVRQQQRLENSPPPRASLLFLRCPCRSGASL